MTFHIQTVEEFSQRQGHVDGSIKDLGVYLKSQGKSLVDKKYLFPKANDLSFISRTHLVEEENRRP